MKKLFELIIIKIKLSSEAGRINLSKPSLLHSPSLSRHFLGEASCDNTKNGCVADFSKPSMKWKLFLGCCVAHAQTLLNAKNHEPLTHVLSCKTHVGWLCYKCIYGDSESQPLVGSSHHANLDIWKLLELRNSVKVVLPLIQICICFNLLIVQ